MNLKIDGTKKILLTEGSQGLTLNTESQNVSVAIGGIYVQGPQGPRGEKGDVGDTGIVIASAPIIYNPSTKIISADTGTGDLQLVLGSDIRLRNERVPTDASVTDAKISSTLSQSKITNLVSDLSAINITLDNKANLSHTHTYSQIIGAGNVISKSYNISGNASSTQVVMGNDTRLTDARTPTGSANGDLSGSTWSNPVIATGAITSAKILNNTIVNDDISNTAAIDQSKINGLINALNSKLDVAKSSASSDLVKTGYYVALNSSNKIDENLLPVQRTIQIEYAANDSAFNTAAVSPYLSTGHVWYVGDKIIKTGGTNPGTYVKYKNDTNTYADWILESLGSGITQINGKTVSPVTLLATDIPYSADSGYANVGDSLTAIRSNITTIQTNVSNKAELTDTRFPTSDQKAALTGTNGTASSNNKFVTDSDPRVTADQSIAVASIRTLGTGSQQAAAGDHTHTALTVQNQSIPSTRAIAGNGTALTVSASDHTHTPASLGASAVGHVHSANDITSDVLKIDYLPVGASSTTVAAGNHPHAFRTSHNFIIQGNIVTSGALAIPPFFAIHGWPTTPTGSSGVVQSDGGMKLVEVHYATTSGTVNFQIYQITDNNPISTGSNTTVILPSGGTLGSDASASRKTASSTASHLDSNDFVPISITDKTRIGIYITGISSGTAPQNLTVTLVFEHRLN